MAITQKKGKLDIQTANTKAQPREESGFFGPTRLDEFFEHTGLVYNGFLQVVGFYKSKDGFRPRADI